MRYRVFVSGRPLAACDNGKPKICKTRVTLGVDENVVLSHREYHTARNKV